MSFETEPLPRPASALELALRGKAWITIKFRRQPTNNMRNLRNLTVTLPSPVVIQTVSQTGSNRNIDASPSYLTEMMATLSVNSERMRNRLCVKSPQLQLNLRNRTETSRSIGCQRATLQGYKRTRADCQIWLHRTPLSVHINPVENVRRAMIIHFPTWQDGM